MAPTCLKISNTTAASSAALSALRNVTGSRGNRAITQANTAHVAMSDTRPDSARNPASMPGYVVEVQHLDHRVGPPDR